MVKPIRDKPKKAQHDVTVHFVGEPMQLRKLDEILTLVKALVAQGAEMAGELAQLQQEVAENATVIDSAIVLIRGIKEALDAAKTDPAALAALSAALDAKEQELAAAIAENTPAEEPPA